MTSRPSSRRYRGLQVPCDLSAQGRELLLVADAAVKGFASNACCVSGKPYSERYSPGVIELWPCPEHRRTHETRLSPMLPAASTWPAEPWTSGPYTFSIRAR